MKCFFRAVLFVATTASLACDHSPVIPDTGTVPPPVPTAAGSFDIDGTRGVVLESASGGIFTLSKQSVLTLTVDSRNPDGTIVWSKVLPHDGSDCIAALSSSGNLVVATADTVFSLTAGTGEVRWRFRSRNTSGIATTSTGKVFVSHNGYNGIPATLYALSDADGSVLWSNAVDAPLGAPFVDDARSTVYYVRRAGAMALDLSTGTIKWQSLLGSDLTLDAAIASDGTVLVARTNDFSGEVTAYGTDGTRLWRNSTFTPRQPTGAPVIDDAGTAYIGSWIGLAGGRLTAITVATGETKWVRDFARIDSNVAVDANRTVYVIAKVTADSAEQLYGVRDGAIVSAAPAFSPSGIGQLTIHSNKLLYYVAGQKVAYIPTAGVSASAAWPTDKHDARKSARR